MFVVQCIGTHYVSEQAHVTNISYATRKRFTVPDVQFVTHITVSMVARLESILIVPFLQLRLQHGRRGVFVWTVTLICSSAVRWPSSARIDALPYACAPQSQTLSKSIRLSGSFALAVVMSRLLSLTERGGGWQSGK